MPIDPLGAAGVTPSLDPISDVHQLLAYHFMVNALEAGTLAAVLGGVVGWFVVARRQTFVAHTLTTTAFPGAAAAALVGVSAAWGYFVFCTLGALALGRLVPGTGRSHTGEGAVIGAVQAFGLASGYLFVSLNHDVLAGLEPQLFGTFLGIGDAQVLALAGIVALALLLIGLLGRPLWFCSVDPDGAAAAALPVRGIGVAFLLALGLAVAAVSQITGALLIFTLLVTPAATATAISNRPLTSLILTLVVALVVTWLGLGIAYFSPYPVGFFVTTISFGLYLLARAWRAWEDRGPDRRRGLSSMQAAG